MIYLVKLGLNAKVGEQSPDLAEDVHLISIGGMKWHPQLDTLEGIKSWNAGNSLMKCL